MECVDSKIVPAPVGNYRPMATRYARRVESGFEYGWCIHAVSSGRKAHSGAVKGAEKARYMMEGCCPTFEKADNEMRRLPDRYVVDGDFGPLVG